MKMKTGLFLIVILLTGTLHACSDNILEQLECHDEIIQHGKEVFKIAREADELLGAENVDHFISSYESKIYEPVWNSVAYFGGRYTFSLQVPIAIDYENCKFIKATNAATIQINEVIKVEIDKAGVAGATEKGQWRLNEAEWKKLVESKEDWSVVNVPIQKNSPPIENFNEFVRQSREPILHRKEGFDKPIQETLEKYQN